MARQVLDHGVIIPAEYSDDWFEDMSTNLNKLDDVIGSDADKLSEAEVSNVALSGDYGDLTNKPDLKLVATSGDYDDLTNKPSYGVLRMTSETLSNSGSGAISNLNSDSKLVAGDYVLDAALKVFLITAVSAQNYTVGSALFQVTNASDLAAVATSGSYDDLNNLPAYGITRFVNAGITDNSNVAFANISSVDKIKAGDFLLDNAGKMYLIASVDLVNETAAVTTPLTQLAIDSDVVHASGNETVEGNKLFEGEINLASSIIVSSDSSYVTGIKDSKLIDKNLFNILNKRVTYNNSRNVRYTWTISNKDSNGNTISSGVQLALSSVGQAYFYPINDNDIFFGASTAYLKGVYTKLINSLTPSSLSLPSDRHLSLDILGYFTNTANGDVNSYTVPSNGYIYLSLNDVKAINLISQTSGGLTNYADSRNRSNNGTILCLFPVRSGDVFKSQWYTDTSVTVVGAFFIPCQGNV